MDTHRFNPRTPAGCDQLDELRSLALKSFNPRTPAGCDMIDTKMMASPKKFQSTHPCGVRREHLADELHRLRVSIHAPLRGAT